ncbi:competence protein CoiA [Paenisporosarcina indica]|uniref:competence protein CoiA n=1 Tax=Paenisporosarcina indica TaxID=650093 RepID=UPI00095013E5|nr:competence protein CoiA family protein [Paenisporosarcina indica]
MFILTAVKDHSEVFTITQHMSREQLLQLRNTSQFTCPQCENPLRLKIGKVVIPHFAHIVINNCLTSFSERESPGHLKGKQQLTEFFARTGCEVAVEAYLPKIAQRPDLLIQQKGKRFAIEFQCSVISSEDVAKRNQGYKSINLPSIWLLSTPNHIHELSMGISYVKLSKFVQSFINKHQVTGATIITYDTTTEQFVYISQLMHIGGTAFVAKVLSLSVDQQTFPFARVKPLSIPDRQRYWHIFQQKRARYLRNRIFSSKFGAQDRFLKQCYVQQIRPENLPLYIGFPIEDSETIQDHLVEWQMALVCGLSRSKIDLKYVSKEWIEMFTVNHCKVFNRNKAVEVVSRYCEFLLELDYHTFQSITHQPMNQINLFNHFHKLIVAKRCEN